MHIEFFLQEHQSAFLNSVRRMAGAAAVALLLALPLALPLANALEMTSLYSVEVPFDPQDPDSKNTYRTALNQVLIRVTGTTAAAESTQLAELFPNPGRYVSTYRKGPDNSVIVSLDGAAIETVLRQSGAMVWGSERPLTLMWLAVDWGQGEREIVAADDAQRLPGASRSIDRNRLLRERVQDVADLRGVPVVFPLLDTEDLQNLSFSDIWGGFDDRLLEASSRYAATSVLVGRIRPQDLQAQRWTWYLNDERQDWTGEPEEIVNLMADALAFRFALRGDEPLDVFRLTISGIDSVVAYGEVQRLVENLAAIDKHVVKIVDGDRITYEVQVQGGVERLQRALAQSRLLEPVETNDAAIDAVIDGSFNRTNEGSYGYDDRPSAIRKSLEYLYRSR